MATSYYDSFIKKLEEIFMMDHAELDFGIYRIMNQKRVDIKQFLERDLLPQVKRILEDNTNNTSEADKARIAELERQLGSNIEALPESIPMVQEYKNLKAKMDQGADISSLENEVYSHLTTFFGRYYDGGDFMSKRRYKDNTYAIPYNGEEVKLYWANCDQYYIKTSEYFKDYTFKLNDGRFIHFVLKDASTEQNNNINQDNLERRFAVYEDENQPTVEVIDGELNIYFTYELMPKTIKQKDLCAMALVKLRDKISSDWSALLAPVSQKDSRSLLEKHLTDYTAKNSFDYFIHKDLGRFLRRELDFYIKNEVLHIDDLDTVHVNSQIATVKAIKGVGEKIIRMLASLEDFQKKLWLKKKFVIQTDYCITLDRVPEEMYEDICMNVAQRQEWVRLFAIDEIKGDLINVAYSEPLTIEFLQQNKFLVVDTAFFNDSFKHKLLANIDNIDESPNGLLINSENFKALELLQKKYKNRVKCTYIDPPYNAKSSEIMYKNTFKHSSWMSLMYDRLNLSKRLNTDNFVLTIAIDEVEQEKIGYILSDIYPENKKICLSIVHNPRGQQGKNISYVHEFAFMVYPNDQTKFLANVKRDEIDSRNLRDSGTESDRSDAATCFYPIIIKDDKIIGFGDVPSDDFHPNAPNVKMDDGSIQVWPIDPNGNEKKWRYGRETVPNIQSKLEPKFTSSYQIIFNQDMGTMKSLWTGAQYDASEYGTKVLQALLSNDGAKMFSYPKSINTVIECTRIAMNEEKNNICLDYFAGSGTTAHAIINQNRSNPQLNNKYILCEMGLYFDNVTRARVEKNIYSNDWDNGKPISRHGVSQCFKYIRLEQYEDSLNNLVVKHDNELFDTTEDDNFKESYMLGYMMDTETKESLFNLQWFINPFAMTLKTTKNNELLETKVDMVETFNYLIGLNVETMHWHQDDSICVVEGITHQDNEKTLIIWRDCNRVNNDQLNNFFERMDYSTLAHEFDVIYVNGDNKLPNLHRDEDRWKVVLIEEEFQKRMFEEI